MSSSSLHFHRFSTQAGWMGLIFSGDTLVRSFLPDRPEGLEARLARDLPPGDVKEGALPAAGREARDLARAYFEGAPVDPAGLSIALDHGPVGPFTREVLDRLRGVPRGRTTTYGELATALGRPQAARAVGRAMAGNRLPLFVPCHRVLAKGGLAGGFSGPGGLVGKQALLTLEGVEIEVPEAQKVHSV